MKSNAMLIAGFLTGLAMLIISGCWCGKEQPTHDGDGTRGGTHPGGTLNEESEYTECDASASGNGSMMYSGAAIAKLSRGLAGAPTALSMTDAPDMPATVSISATVVEPSVWTINPDHFQQTVPNGFENAAKDHLSTFSVDVDTGSYTLCRKSIETGSQIHSAAVRVEEWVNYFNYGYDAPTDAPFAVHIDAAPSPVAKDRIVLRIGVQGKHLSESERKAVHLTFLADVSGSMSNADKLPLAQQAMKRLVENLQRGDTVALATYAGWVAKLLDPTDVSDRKKIFDAIDKLTAGGSTAMSSGIDLAYQMADAAYVAGDVNRVIILSDGDANVGPASHTEILKQIKSYADKNITLTTLGFGAMGWGYNDQMMEQIADAGNGNYFFIDCMAEADRVFGDKLTGALEVIAKDVKIQVDFNPGLVESYRLVGYENRAIADRDFSNDFVDAGEIGAGHTVTAVYEVILRDAKPSTDADTKILIARLRHKEPEGTVSQLTEYPFEFEKIGKDFSAMSADYRMAVSVAYAADILREGPTKEVAKLADIIPLAEKAAAGDDIRAEFVGLMKKIK